LVPGGQDLFGAVSGAVPHVSGGISLIRSWFDNELYPEDYEWILKLTADDYVPEGDGGGHGDENPRTWNSYTGHGNLSLDLTFDFLAQDGLALEDYATTGASIIEYLPQTDYTFTKGALIGTFSVIPCSLTTTIQYEHDYVGVPLVWGRCRGTTTGVSAANPSYVGKYCRVESAAIDECVVSTYVFRVEFSPGEYIWYPTSPNNVVVECRVLGVLSSKHGVAGEVKKASRLTCSSSGKGVRIAYRSSPGVTGTFIVIDVRGRVVDTVEGIVDENGTAISLWNGTSQGGACAPSGVYFVQARFGEERGTGRVVLLR
jgi:hypothetical protein